MAVKAEVIDLGCGRYPHPDSDVRVDVCTYPHITHCYNLLNIPYPFASDAASKVYLHEVLEHISIFRAKDVLRECYRILRPGGVLSVTCPDVRWIIERIIKNDWKSRAKGSWLHRYDTTFENAMSYLFGGFYTVEEWDKPGMGHVAGYDEATLIKTLADALSGIKPFVHWRDIRRVADERNECILKVLATK